MVCNKTVKSILTILMVAVLCLTSFSVYAAGEKTGSITIVTLVRETKQIVDGATFRLYPVATAKVADNRVTFTYTKDFKGNGLAVDNLSDAYSAAHLMVYATDHNLPYTEKVSDSTGSVFYGDLPCGAYLVVPVGIKDGYLKPNPFVVFIPSKTDDGLTYDINATPKVEIDLDTPGKTRISVTKKWKGTTKTPNSVTVALVKDGSVVDTAILNEGNHWHYEWTDLEKNHAWYVIEPDVPEDYTVSYSDSQKSVTITNATTPTGEEPPLVQTGQLNWPVPILLIVGMVLISIGWSMLNFGSKDEETT